jgi:transcriptional regulator with XRE-family HTH domain
MSTTTLESRIKLAMKESSPRVTQADLARACGIAPPSVNNWLNGRTQTIKGAALVKASRLLRVNPAWLSLGTGPMRSNGAEEGTWDAPAPQPVLSAVIVAEVASALRARLGAGFRIEHMEGAKMFAHWYAVRLAVPDGDTLARLIELDIQRAG